MEKQFKELEAKLLVLKNLVEIAYSYVNQAQDRSRDFAVFCLIFEVIKNNTDNIWGDYVKIHDQYTSCQILPNLNN